MSVNISVVLPTYKRPSLLMKSIQSLVGQTFDKASYEIIVVSDGPDEETEKVLDQWSGVLCPAIRFFALDKRSGPAAARNAGWRKGRGQLIAFTDDDCIADPSWLSALWKDYQKSGPNVVYAGKITVPISAEPTDYEVNIAKLETAEFVTANCACPKAALERVGGFDEKFRMAWREDSDLHFNFLENEVKVLRCDDAVVVHPVREASWGISIAEQKKTMFNALLYKKYPGLYRKKIQKQPPWLYYVIVLCFILFLICSFYSLPTFALFSLALWGVATLTFIIKRLSVTTRSTGHVIEMVLTSMVIPFIAIYWRLYGSLKYKKLLI